MAGVAFLLWAGPRCQRHRSSWHEDMDLAILAAYDLSDIEAPAYVAPEADAERLSR